MILIERTAVMNLDGAIRGARNPMNSWARSDSFYDEKGNFVVGQADLEFGHRLAQLFMGLRAPRMALSMFITEVRSMTIMAILLKTVAFVRFRCPAPRGSQ